MAIYVQLFGVAQVHQGAERIAFAADMRFWLLAYLAYRGDWVGRDQLAYLFWPDEPSQTARKNLRHLLSRVRSLDFAEVETHDEQVRWRVESDVTGFQQSLAQGHWAEALEGYGSSLLEGLEADLPEYQNWLSQERQNLHSAFREAALNHSQQLEPEHPTQAHALLGKVLKADLLAEDVMQAYLRTAQHSSQRNEALKVYENFKTLLLQELGLEPLETTRQLAEALRPAVSVEATAVASAAKLRNFLNATTAFVGRDVDLSEIAGFFKDPEVRLLTLIGPGGMGKTRLALQVGLEQQGHFADGAVFVPLAGLASPDGLVPAIATALSLSFSSQTSPQAQLEAHLRDLELLLILDNFEHLLDGAGLVAELLEGCPKLRILTTTREALELQGEYLLDVSGLAVPKNEHSPHIEAYDAVQLFLRRVRQINPHFSLTDHERPYVARICRMLHGSPLAIELATHWLRLLNVQEVAEEIQKNLDFLQAQQPDRPPRHHSLRAVFEHSWHLLEEKEQTALQKLALFKGGFSKEAAEAAGGVALRTLLTLTNKSLLYRQPSGRFERHAMVGEFSEEKLAENPTLYNSQLEQHGLYYFGFLETRPMGGPHDGQYLQEIEADLENLRAAWGWAVENKRTDQLERSADLVVFYDRRARFEEGAKLFRATIEVLDEAKASHHAALGKAYVDVAWLYLRLGRYEQARAYAAQAAELLGEADHPITLMKAVNTLGIIEYTVGNHSKARECASRALALARTYANASVVAGYLGNLAIIEQKFARFDYAAACLAEALTIHRHSGNQFGVVLMLNNLGLLNTYLDRLDDADAYLQEGLQIAQEIGYAQYIPYLLSNRASVTFKQHQYDLAHSLCLNAMQVVGEHGASTLRATLFMTLGRITTALSNPSQARDYFRSSLEIVWGIRELPIVMENLVGLAELNFKLGQLDTTAELLNMVIPHSATEPWYRRDAEALYGQLPKSYQATPTKQAGAGALEEIVTALLDGRL